MTTIMSPLAGFHVADSDILTVRTLGERTGVTNVPVQYLSIRIQVLTLESLVDVIRTGGVC
jgi:hypothetical protein